VVSFPQVSPTTTATYPANLTTEYSHKMEMYIYIYIGVLTYCLGVRLMWDVTQNRHVNIPRCFESVAYPGILLEGGGVSTNSVEDRGERERGCGGDSPLVRGSGGSCNLVQEISFHIVKFS
jgi:hypothetical protein